MLGKGTARTIALALAGLVLAVGVGLAANAVSEDSIGLSANRLQAEDALAPPGARDAADRRATERRLAARRAARRKQRQAERAIPTVTTPTQTTPTVTTEEGDDHGGGDSSGKGRGRGRGRSGGDDD